MKANLFKSDNPFDDEDKKGVKWGNDVKDKEV